MPITALRVDAIVVYTADTARCRAFYEGLLGVTLEDRTLDPLDPPHWGGFVQKTYFAIQQRPLTQGAEQRVAVCFQVEDLTALVEKLRCAGTPIASEPASRSYGRIASVHDPEGNLVYLHELVPSQASSPSPGAVAGGDRSPGSQRES